MSTQPVQDIQPTVQPLLRLSSSRPAPTRRSARIRAATVRRRVLQVTDALTAANILLAVNLSVTSIPGGQA